MRRSIASRSATPLELLALPPLETYTSKLGGSSEQGWVCENGVDDGTTWTKR